jgi:hypothetical protein
MIDFVHELEQRRMALQERSSMQRILIAQSCTAIAARTAVVDRAFAVARGIAARPLFLGSLAAAALIIGPRKVLGWAARAATTYSAARQLAGLLRDRPA